MSKQTLFRSHIETGVNKVDKDKGIITGFSVMSLGEVKGHGMESDRTTLEQLIELGNKPKIGIKSRFGHPNMSSEALGTHIGRVTNFRFSDDETKVLGDLKLDKTSFNTPNGDLGSYVLELAESDPDAFGTSIVFHNKSEFRVDDDGLRLKDESGEELPPLVRIQKLLDVDVVDEPAANNGMFSAFSDSVKPSAEMSQFLDVFLNQPDSVDKVMGFLNRYTTNKFKKESITMSELTIEKLKSDHSDLVEQLSSEFEAKNLSEARESAEKDGFKEGFSDGVKSEKERVAKIIECSKKYELSEEAFSIIASDVSSEEALSAVKDKKIEQLQSRSSESAGQVELSEEVRDEDLPEEELFEREYNSDVKIRKEFKKLSTYVAYRKRHDK